MIDFDPDQLLTLGGEAQFKYAAPGSFSGDTADTAELLFYLVVEHTELPEFILGTVDPEQQGVGRDADGAVRQVD